MGKCSRCGRKGIFLRLSNGICSNCQIILKAEEERDLIKSQTEKLSEELLNKEALYTSIKEQAIADGLIELNHQKDLLTQQLSELQSSINNSQEKIDSLLTQQEKAEKNTESATRKLQKHRELIRMIQHVNEEYLSDVRPQNIESLISKTDELLQPTVTLNLKCLDMRELRKRYKQNEKSIKETLERYESRYTSKANIAIYRLMVIALSAELQNVLYNIGYGRLDDALSQIKSITDKYLFIATDGNQSIAPTMRKFIGEIDFYFQEAIRIEYEYYVQKERTKEEQRALREQMRQEAEERRQLEQQRKQIEKEESKYHDQINQISSQLAVSQDEEKVKQLEEKLAELQKQLSSVSEKRDEIIRLQNGKAGHVYIISNIGSFGEDVFKIGMTRRLDPEERINELGSASVPFPFDIHSFIFSDDAVSLENQLHKTLNDYRVNKVNLRKEFFRVSLDDIEKLVNDIAPTAEFKRTMLAEQYRQSLSIGHIEDIVISNDDDDE